MEHITWGRRASQILSWAPVVVALVAATAAVLWTVVPRFAEFQPQVVLSGSMEPELKIGSIALVQPAAIEEIVVGDVITFRHPDSDRNEVLVTHRVIEILENPTRFRTQGDANQVADAWEVPTGNVVGEVNRSIPYLGYVVLRVRDPRMLFLLVLIPAGLMIATEVRSISAEFAKRGDRQLDELHRRLRALADRGEDSDA
jgi:signal peptidase I